MTTRIQVRSWWNDGLCKCAGHSRRKSRLQSRRRHARLPGAVGKTGAAQENWCDRRRFHPIRTNAALYCVIDNRRQKHARKLWRIARSDIEKNGRLAIQINESAPTERDSYLIVDAKRPREFTKHLFATLAIKESVENMLHNAFKL